MYIVTYVNGFAKTLHLHTSYFSTLVNRNLRTIKDIVVKALHIVKQLLSKVFGSLC